MNSENVSLLRKIVRVIFRQNKYLEHRANIREVYFGIRIRFLGLLALVVIAIISTTSLIMYFNQKESLEKEKYNKALTLTRILGGPAEYYLDKTIDTSKEELRIKYKTIKRECTNFKNYNDDIAKIVLTDEKGRVKYSTYGRDYKRQKIFPYIKEALQKDKEELISYDYTCNWKNKKTGDMNTSHFRAITQPLFLNSGNVFKLIKDYKRFYKEYKGSSRKRKKQIDYYLYRRYASILPEDFKPEAHSDNTLTSEISQANDIDFLFQYLFRDIMKYRQKYIPQNQKWLWNDGWLFTLKKAKTQAYINDNSKKAKEIEDLIEKRINNMAEQVDDIRRLGAIAIVFDVDAINSATSKNIRDVMGFAGIMIVISIFIFFIILTLMIQNLKKLERWAIAVSNGDIQSRIDIKTNDEIGRLGDITNFMLDELTVKYHLEKYVSNSTHNMISESKGQMLSPDLGITNRENLAFLFADVRGFTSFSEQNDPETVVEVLNHYLELQSNIVKSNDGDIDDYVGDEIMAHFAGPDRADRAIATAVSIQKNIKKSNRERVKNGLPVFEVGIGVHGGDVVVGNIGSQFRMDFACIGDAVNLASRLCSSAKAGEIISSRELFKLARKKWSHVTRRPIEVKGKEKKISIVKINTD